MRGITMWCGKGFHFMTLSWSATKIKDVMNYTVKCRRVMRSNDAFQSLIFLSKVAYISHHTITTPTHPGKYFWGKNSVTFNPLYKLIHVTYMVLLLMLSLNIFIKNVVAVAAYSRLASRSQAKFHTKKLSPLVRPCAAAPAQSTTSAHRSLRFSHR